MTTEDLPTGLAAFSLAGRTALVTGSSRGIGLAIARGLAKAGAAIVLNGRDEATLDAAADGLEDGGAFVRTCPFDVTDHAASKAAVDDLEARHGPVHILVNNAGMQHRAPLADFPPEAFERLMATNVSSVFNVGQAVARHMIARRQGKIINIASVQTLLARPSVGPYMATKGAVANLTRAMATEWAPLGLNVNAIAPGYFETELTAPLVADPTFSDWLATRTPQGRWGRLPELVGAAVFLSSDAASFVNGHTLFVDGGITISL
ncbi:glucose 1-dehydrogenase [Acuticoccus sp.]|uniref:glucose 1-dehydrogenase n=1 Tax=Acuticoccus sp. TaxID=1904378 RepID=UPI003B51B590